MRAMLASMVRTAKKKIGQKPSPPWLFMMSIHVGMSIGLLHKSGGTFSNST